MIADIEPVVVQINPLPPLEQLKAMWQRLEARAEPSFFLSWHWIGTWLAETRLNPALLVALRNDVIVGLALIGQVCPRLPRRPTIYLNQSGLPDFDCVYIEYNDILLDSTCVSATRAACLAAFSDRPSIFGGRRWREMHWAASAVPPEQMPVHRNAIMKKSKKSVSPYVDLDKVRCKGGDLLTVLNANTRRQIRRAIQLYEAMGELRLDPASTKQEALAWFEALRGLHQARWTSRGQLGAFARPFFERFSRRLLERGFGEGSVDILRLRAGRHEIGFLYNFVYRDRVSNYQCGFQFGPDGRHKPGLVAHALAIRHYASVNPRLMKYSFLAGPTQYKTSLATDFEVLCWYTYRPASRLMRVARLINCKPLKL